MIIIYITIYSTQRILRINNEENVILEELGNARPTVFEGGTSAV